MTRFGAALLLVAAVVVAACYGGGSRPTPLPGELADVVSGLVLRGATITRHVSGDAGCEDPRLYGNAVRLDVSMTPAAEPSSVYVLGWRRQTDFDNDAAAFAECVAGAQATYGAEATVIESPPWRAYGLGWSDDLREAVEESIRAAH